MLALALAISVVALALSALHSLDISLLERKADKDRALLRDLQRDQRDLRQIVEHERAQLRRAELQVDAGANQLGRLRDDVTARLTRECRAGNRGRNTESIQQATGVVMRFHECQPADATASCQHGAPVQHLRSPAA